MSCSLLRMPFAQPLCPLIVLPHRVSPCLARVLPSDSPQPSFVEVVARPGVQPLPFSLSSHLGTGPLPLRISAALLPGLHPEADLGHAVCLSASHLGWQRWGFGLLKKKDFPRVVDTGL